MLKYNAKIYQGIVKSLAQNQAESGGLTYSRLYKKLVSHLGRPLSHRDYSAHLEQMKKDKILYTLEIKDKKRSIYYRFTQNAINLYKLRILGTGKEYEKRLSLYHLLLYFETFKRGQILTEKQLNKLLKKIGSSKNKLRQVNSPDFRNIKNTIRGYEEPISEIEILELSPKEFGGTSTQPNYYVLQRGFSIPEFISYLDKIRNDEEPRPFSAYPVLVPYVHSNNYNDTEIEEAVNLLEKANLLKAITLSINKKEKRFRVANKELINLTQQLRLIGTIYFRKIIMKIGFVDKPSEKEKAVMSYFYGEKRAGHVISFLNDERKKLLNEYPISKLKKIKQFLKKLCSLIQKLLEDCRKQNESITKDDFLKQLCLPFELSIDKI